MNKILNLIIFLFVSIACFSSIVFSQTTQNKNSDFGELILDKRIIYLPCPPISAELFNCPRGTSINATTKFHTSAKKLKYEYSVSGGRIIGSGETVEWDLSSLRPGTYIITVTVRGTHKLNKTLRESVTVTGCVSCHADCLICPRVSIQSLAETVKQNTETTFTAVVEFANSDLAFTYNWEISNGEIIEGQGTTKIKVRANNSSGQDLTITLKVGDTCPLCTDTFIKTIKIIPE